MMTKEESTKFVNFMTPGRGYCAGAWSYCEHAIFLLLFLSLLYLTERYAPKELMLDQSLGKYSITGGCYIYKNTHNVIHVGFIFFTSYIF